LENCLNRLSALWPGLSHAGPSRLALPRQGNFDWQLPKRSVDCLHLGHISTTIHGRFHPPAPSPPLSNYCQPLTTTKADNDLESLRRGGPHLHSLLNDRALSHRCNTSPFVSAKSFAPGVAFVQYCALALFAMASDMDESVVFDENPDDSDDFMPVVCMSVPRTAASCSLPLHLFALRVLVRLRQNND
jgi:hypothetical protein